MYTLDYDCFSLYQSHHNYSSPENAFFLLKYNKCLHLYNKGCDERNKMVNHIISECSKLAQNEYKNRHDWLR